MRTDRTEPHRAVSTIHRTPITSGEFNINKLTGNVDVEVKEERDFTGSSIITSPPPRRLRLWR